jgi:hypothetical protein
MTILKANAYVFDCAVAKAFVDTKIAQWRNYFYFGRTDTTKHDLIQNATATS